MNQDILFEYLKEQVRVGNDKFFSIRELESQAESLGIYKKSIRLLVIKLYAWGYLEINREDIWNRKYRAKLSLVYSEVKSPLSKDITAKELKKLE